MLQEDFLPDYGLTVAGLAEAVGVSRQSINELLRGRLRPRNGVEIDWLVLALQFGAAHFGAFETGGFSRIQKNICNQNLIDISLVLNAGRRIDDIAENIPVLD